MKKPLKKSIPEKDEKMMKNGNQEATKHHQNGVRGGRAECLHPAQHSLQHKTLKIVAHHEKGKVPAANKRKGACGEDA